MLLNRRECVTVLEEFAGRKFHISIGRDPETQEVCEVFCYTGKNGSEAQALMIEICRDWSRAMQQDGVSPEAFASRVTRMDNGEPISSAGFLADVLLAESRGDI